MLALFGSALTGEILAFDVPKSIAVVKAKAQGKASQECAVLAIFTHVFIQLIVKLLPQLLSTEDVSRAEEGDAREPQVLVQHEYSHWDEVGVAQVVNEAADVAIVAGVNAIHFPILERKNI